MLAFGLVFRKVVTAVTPATKSANPPATMLLLSNCASADAPAKDGASDVRIERGGVTECAPDLATYPAKVVAVSEAIGRKSG